MLGALVRPGEQEVADGEAISIPSWVGSAVAAVFLALSGYALKTASDAFYAAQSNHADILRIDASLTNALHEVSEMRTEVFKGATTLQGHEKFNEVTDQRLQALRTDVQQVHDQIYRVLEGMPRRPLFSGDQDVPGQVNPPRGGPPEGPVGRPRP